MELRYFTYIIVLVNSKYTVNDLWDKTTPLRKESHLVFDFESIRFWNYVNCSKIASWSRFYGSPPNCGFGGIPCLRNVAEASHNFKVRQKIQLIPTKALVIFHRRLALRPSCRRIALKMSVPDRLRLFAFVLCSSLRFYFCSDLKNDFCGQTLPLKRSHPASFLFEYAPIFSSP